MSKNRGDYLSLSFTGTGIEYIAQKAEGYGDADLYLDGKLEKKLQLGLKNFPVITGVLVFQKQGLSRSPHTLKIASGGTGPFTVQAFKIYR